VLDPDDRAAAFARVHANWFREWGLASILGSAAGRFAVLRQALTALAFRKARGRNDEEAELYRDAEGQCRGIVALRSERFSDDLVLTPLLHHELAHLADMVDERFGYSPDLAPLGQTVSQQRLTRERYRVLWDLSIDGRLTQRGLATVAGAAQRRQELDRGFAFLPEDRRLDLFAALWGGQLARHNDLLQIASDPRGLHHRHTPVPGGTCRLCGFAAFHWTDPATLRPEATKRIRSEFPGWTETESVCARCAEIYESVTGVEYPATVCL
jgi:hypothetical protein